jgi:hypothetical protein
MKSIKSIIAVSALFVAAASFAGAQVLAHSGDIAGFGGYGTIHNSGDPSGDSHPTFGASAGYNVTPGVTVLGEYTYMTLGNFGSGVTSKVQLFGGAARFNFLTSTKVVPYGVVAFGDMRPTESASGTSISGSGYYSAFGGGASIYCGKNWGIRPEFRFVRSELKPPMTTSYTGYNVFMESGSIFFQFGGTSAKKTTKK